MSGAADEVVIDDEVVEKVEGEQDKATGQPDYLSMSDEELMKMGSPTPVAEPVVEVKKEEKPAAAAVLEGGSVEPPELAAGDAKKKEDEPKKVVVEDLKDPEAKAKPPVEAKPKTEVVAPKDEGKVNFEAEYKRLLAPFNANGKQLAVENVDEAISLMQMGANYNKKMAALKPTMKLVKMLENNGLLSEEKIGFLIDLGKKNPGAINKLVQDSGIDPMDLGADKASAYKQTAYAVDDREMELDTVLEDLQGTTTYTQTLDLVSNKWDAASKQVVARAPQLLKLINDHMASGVYERISKEMDRGRVLGRLNGLSDIEAYRQVGDAIQARGGFDDLFQKQSQTDTPAPVVVQPKPKVEDDDKLKDKKRAASSSQPAAPSATAKDFNPLHMSDAEFSKLVKDKLL